jgi:hypothetical protein
VTGRRMVDPRRYEDRLSSPSSRRVAIPSGRHCRISKITGTFLWPTARNEAAAPTMSWRDL